ncbi:MAG: AAA family ATPase [Candidatus Omnitrophota bacterium]
MYSSFFGLNEKPFSVTPNTRFFFPSEKHEEALSSLIYTIQGRQGFAAISGEIGSGKTTVWHALLNKLDKGTKIALITNTQLTPKQMIIAIIDDLSIPYHERWTKVRLLAALNRYLIEQISLGCNVVLVIDEAQNLSFQALEEIRMLSNLETESEKLLQIMLMGQPTLRDLLIDPRLEQLRQRINVYYHLMPLNHDETKGYIAHRLKVAGANGHTIFDTQSLDKIFEHSGGIPRRINRICDKAMLTGFIRSKNTIDESIVDEVIKEIDLLSPIIKGEISHG